MTSKYFRRWLKLVGRKALTQSLAFTTVLISVVLVLVGASWLPSLQRPISPAVLASKISFQPPPPAVSAAHVFVQDLATDMVLYSKAADTPIAPASTTKMMTALVAHAAMPLDRQIIIDRAFPEGQDIGLEPGEHITVEQLIYATLIQSGNDAAEVLAENYPGGRAAFIAAMNDHAATLRLTNTTFKNPTGLDEAGHLSTAADLARLGLAVLKDPFLARIVSSETALLTAPESSRVLTNTNQLLGRVPGVLGIKTGYTDAAGEALITLIDRDSRRTLIVVLKSTNRFGDTESLINWIYAN